MYVVPATLQSDSNNERAPWRSTMCVHTPAWKKRFSTQTVSIQPWGTNVFGKLDKNYISQIAAQHFKKTPSFLQRKRDLLYSTVMLRLVRGDSCNCFSMAKCSQVPNPPVLHSTGSEQLGVCPAEPAPWWHPNYASPVAFPELSCSLFRGGEGLRTLPSRHHGFRGDKQKCGCLAEGADAAIGDGLALEHDLLSTLQL